MVWTGRGEEGNAAVLSSCIAFLANSSAYQHGSPWAFYFLLSFLNAELWVGSTINTENWVKSFFWPEYDRVILFSLAVFHLPAFRGFSGRALRSRTSTLRRRTSVQSWIETVLGNTASAPGSSQMRLILKINGIFSGLEGRDAVVTAKLLRCSLLSASLLPLLTSRF